MAIFNIWGEYYENNWWIKEKEIIYAKGNTVWNISYVNWNPESKKVKSIIVTQGGAPAKIWLGKKIVIKIIRNHSAGISEDKIEEYIEKYGNRPRFIFEAMDKEEND